MRPHFLFPAHPIRPALIDEMFADQWEALTSKGFSASLCPESVIQNARPLRNIPVGSTVCYRGWMMNAVEYDTLAAAVVAAGATMLTSPHAYLATHHLPNWYSLIAEFTPETRVFLLTDLLADEMRALGWDAFFIKDYVKAVKTSVGSIVRDPSQIGAIVAEMQRIRGEVEGGICVRRVEDFLPDTERRYFVIDRHPFDAGGATIPDVVQKVAKQIPSRFFSVDAIQRRDGVLRIVEVGDGQVSDLVGWTPDAFANAMADRFSDLRPNSP